MKITKANKKATDYACKHFHYSKTTPTVQYAYNIYNDNGDWCGVIIFGGGATPNIGKPFGLNQGEVLELVRVAMNGKQGHNATSQAVGMALRQLHKDDPICKLVVSYADCDQNHYGTIYQATNWIYLGKTNEGLRSAFIINGKKIHPRSVGAKGGVQSIEWIKANWDKNAKEFITEGKHKYIYPFDKKLKKEWINKAQPYPKKQ